eukprot:3075832-Karenia_brevis.AAC.1
MALPESQRTLEEVNTAMVAVHDWAKSDADALRSFVAIMSFGGVFWAADCHIKALRSAVASDG